MQITRGELLTVWKAISTLETAFQTMAIACGKPVPSDDYFWQEIEKAESILEEKILD